MQASIAVVRLQSKSLSFFCRNSPLRRDPMAVSFHLNKITYRDTFRPLTDVNQKHNVPCPSIYRNVYLDIFSCNRRYRTIWSKHITFIKLRVRFPVVVPISFTNSPDCYAHSKRIKGDIQWQYTKRPQSLEGSPWCVRLGVYKTLEPRIFEYAQHGFPFSLTKAQTRPSLTWAYYTWTAL